MSESAIRLSDPRADLADSRDDILAAIAQVVDSGQYILGPQVDAFERRIAGELGAAGAVGVASGTDALALGLLGLGVNPGDEVITVSHTAGPTVAAIRMIGAVPVLVDVEAETYCLDPAVLEAAIGPRTKAILPVHLYGHPADLDGIGAIAARAGIPVMEDCAQAHGATYAGRQVGAIGAVGCFSFYPTKNLGALGDGGLVCAVDPAHVERLRRLRTYGWTRPQYAELPFGRCSRLDELQAAVLNVKLAKLNDAIVKRRAIAHRYDAAFAGLPLVLPTERTDCRHVFHLYVMRCDRRDALAQHLKKCGIGTGLHYPHPVHAQPGLMDGVRISQPLRVTEAIAGEILTLPLYPSMPEDSQGRVIDAVRGFFGNA
jgi:dTDP-4-amino-4,6-dideoxygalactose transaminase